MQGEPQDTIPALVADTKGARRTFPHQSCPLSVAASVRAVGSFISSMVCKLFAQLGARACSLLLSTGY